jgi:uncharacterized zinc-type alcohol dehydrogenase-like protein
MAEQGLMTQAYVTTEAGMAVTSQMVPRAPCGPTDVVVEMIVSGLCRSDLSMVTNEWGRCRYPMVAGHEGIGRVVQVGDLVKRRKVGQLVGLGWMRNSCQNCCFCNAAKENLCGEMQMHATVSMFSLKGTFAEFCVSPEKFAIPIPEGLDLVGAAPLVCAGITVYNPLSVHATHMSKVLVVSLGGLGGLALQFASKMGCEVVCMSRGEKKKAQALSFGAQDYIDSTVAEQLKASNGSFDLILDTSPVTADMDLMLPLLKPGGKYVTVGMSSDGKKNEVGNMALVPSQKSVSGSIYGSISQLEDMMIFAARHGIVAECETMPMSKLEEAMRMLHDGKNQKTRIVVVREDKLEAHRKSS